MKTIDTTTVFVCRCHSEENQGASIPPGGVLTEWNLALQLDLAINACMWTHHDTEAQLLEDTLPERINQINEYTRKPKLAIEVHFNAGYSPAQSGFHVEAYQGSRDSLALAGYVLAEMARAYRGTGIPNNGVNRVNRDYRWIGTEKSYRANRQGFVMGTSCPAILVEAGFLTNPRDAAYLEDRSHRSDIGWQIGNGIIRYLREFKK